MALPVFSIRIFPAVLAFALPWLNVSCTAPEELEDRGLNGYWAGATVQGEPKIEIDLNQQRLRYFKGGNLVGMARISSGRESHATRPGQFRILDKDRDHRSSLYGAFVTATGEVVKPDVDSRRDVCPPGARFEGADMPHFMRIVGGIGLHAGFLPGYPASHGCIRLPKRMAELFYEVTPLGTPVIIIGQAATAVMKEDKAVALSEKSRPAAQQEPRSFFPNPFAGRKSVAAPARKPAPQYLPANENPQQPEKSGGFFQRLFAGQKPAAKPARKPASEPQLPKPQSKESRRAPQRSLPTWKKKPPPGTTRYL